MIAYDLDKAPEFSNEEIFNAIKLTIQGKISHNVDDNFNIFLVIGELLRHITDSNLLDSTLTLLRESGFISKIRLKSRYKSFLIFEGANYNSKDLVRIKAIYSHCLVMYEYYKKLYKTINPEPLPILNIRLENRFFLVNLDMIYEILKSDYNIRRQEYIKELSSMGGQEIEYSKWIYSLGELDLIYGTDSPEIKKLKTLKENIENQILTQPPYPFIVVGAFEAFKKFVNDRQITEHHLDYGYLKKKLEDTNLITSITDFKFMQWLLDEGFITEKWYSKLNEKGGFYPLNKLNKPEREVNFSNYFNHLL
ncbi:MAG: hypothetical protein CL868_06495 [Cytophagaceae bacterium]|nr:hypothetical protein [Cytophagaceae bacterium]|tara:strand:+ start:21980 stop:22903 length:924 start_codon:yes stop_codon:yes gene_type:complete